MKEFRELTRRRKKPIPIAVRIAGCKPGMRISRRKAIIEIGMSEVERLKK